MRDILLDELKKVVENRRVKVPGHVGGAQYYEHDFVDVYLRFLGDAGDQFSASIRPCAGSGGRRTVIFVDHRWRQLRVDPLCARNHQSSGRLVQLSHEILQFWQF